MFVEQDGLVNEMVAHEGKIMKIVNQLVKEDYIKGKGKTIRQPINGHSLRMRKTS